MAGIEAIFFDLDGVLVDATDWHYAALNRALELFGYTISRFDHLSTYNGLPTRRKLEMLSVEKGLPRALHPLISRAKQGYTQEEVLRSCWPSFEKEYLLARLRREGYRLAVCSNAVLESVELMLRRAGVVECFELLVGNEAVHAPKPDPWIYLHAMKNMGLQADQVLIVEDSPHGLEAARRSGAHVCAVSGFAEVDYWRIRRELDRVHRPALLSLEEAA